MKSFAAFVKKEFFHIFRDSKTLLMLFGLPIVLILLFGFALTNEIADARVVVCDLSRSELSVQLTDRIAQNTSFILDEVTVDRKGVEEAFKRGDVKLALIIPASFSEEFFHQGRTAVQLIGDATDPNTANTLVQYASAIIRDFQQDQWRLSPKGGLINVETTMLYNPELKGAMNYVPGVMALVLLLVCVLMTSVSIVKEKEMGTMEVLLASPVSPIWVVIAKVVPYFVLSLVNLAIILLLSVYVLDMEIRGSVFLLYGASSLFLLTALSLGLLISNSTDSQQSAMLISLMGMMIPTMLFTGFMFPIENMPKPLQWVSHIVPSKYYYTIVKAVMVKGLGVGSILRELSILGGMTLFLGVISIKKFKIRLA